MKIGINCGHTLSGTIGGGAVGFLDESNETRNVGYVLMNLFKQNGDTIIDCTDDRSNSVSENLNKICTKANAQSLDMFISLHFNAGGGQGVECWTYDGKDVCNASNICKEISKLGFKNRGIKDGRNLYVVKHTNSPACLIEICFVDTKTDADLYSNLGVNKIANAIFTAITGKVKENKEELTMSQYEELNEKIDNLTETVKILANQINDLVNPMIYNYIDDNMPEWARDGVQYCVDNGYIKGDENGDLNLDDKDLRYCTIIKRIKESK